MAGAAVQETVTLAGRAERTRAARAFVSAILGPGHPCGDVADMLVSEIFGNSVRHTGSGGAGETITVAVISGGGTVRVEVTDRAGPGTPELRPTSRDAEGGRGLQLVASLAARWDWRRRGERLVTWFEYFRTPTDVFTRRLAGDIPGVYLRRAKEAVPARCGTGRRSRLPGQLHRS